MWISEEGKEARLRMKWKERAGREWIGEAKDVGKEGQDIYDVNKNRRLEI